MPLDLYIRPYKPDEDREQFVALNYQTFWDSIPTEEKIPETDFRAIHAELLKRYLPNDPNRASVTVAASESERYLGHCWMGLQSDFFTGKTQPWIFDLSVRPEYRRQGVGQFLMDDCKHRCRLMGLTSIGLQVLNHNGGAVGLYENMGFKLKARSMVLYL